MRTFGLGMMDGIRPRGAFYSRLDVTDEVAHRRVQPSGL
jgi:hypothetical protein